MKNDTKTNLKEMIELIQNRSCYYRIFREVLYGI